MGREWELKYAASPDALDRIAADAQVLALTTRQETLRMESLYFDTPACDLSRRQWTLRLRRENARAVVTMKTAGDGTARGEWEYEADSPADAADTLCALGAPAELKTLLAGGVRQVCGASFTRRAYTLALDGCTAELALDCGRLLHGEREAPLCEMELELKRGDPAAVTALAALLAARYGLTPEPRSKFYRAVSL